MANGCTDEISQMDRGKMRATISTHKIKLRVPDQGADGPACTIKSGSPVINTGELHIIGKAMSDNDSLFDELKKTAENSADAIAEITDTSLEALVHGSALDNIPIISSSLSIFKIKDEFHRARLKRNVFSFLKALKDGEQENLKGFFWNVSTDPQKRDEFVDTTLSILLDGEKPLKAWLLGNLICAASRSKITYDQFDELSLIVLSGSIPALRDVPKYFKRRIASKDADPEERERDNTSYYG